MGVNGQRHVLCEHHVERTPQQELLGRVRQMLLAADHVGDAVAPVIGHVGERVEDGARRLRDDEVVDGVIGELDVTADLVMHDRHTVVGRLEAKRGAGPTREPAVTAESVVTGGLVLPLTSLNVLAGAVAVVQVSTFEQRLGRRDVRRVLIALTIGSLVEVETEPRHRGDDATHPFLAIALDVGVLDAQDEDTLVRLTCH